MLSYKKFEEILKNTFAEYLPSHIRQSLEVKKVRRINDEPLAICLQVGESSSNVTGIYVRDVYEDYCRKEDLQSAFATAAEKLTNLLSEYSSINIDAESAKSHIVFQLVNTEQNAALLSEIPHKEFLDLSIIYRWIVKIDKGGIHSAILTNEDVQQLGLTEEQIFEFAKENVYKIMPPVAKPMHEYIADLGYKDIELQEAEPPVLVISNTQKHWGANGMLDENLLHHISQTLGYDLYILPSSIHEIIIVTVKDRDLEVLEEMVKSINATDILPKDKLSDHVYFYNRTEQNITVAENALK